MVMTTAHETLGAFFGRQLPFFASQGFDVLAVCTPGPGLEKLRGLGGVAVHGLPMQRKPHPARDLIALFALRKLMSEFRPHIVHAHTPKAGLLGMLAATLVRVPVRLYTIHGLPLLTRSGWQQHLLKWAERVCCGLSTRTYCISPSLESVVRQMGLCAGGKLTTPGDGSCAGVDLDKFDPRRFGPESRENFRRLHGIPAQATLLCYAGRIAKDKGIEILAAAWKQLSVRFPHLHLLVCGEYDATDPVPEAALNSLRSDERVHLSGEWIDDMPPVYAAGDIWVLPTFREGLSQVALECGAMQVPLVGTRIPGLVNAVQDGVTGLLVPPGDAESLAGGIARLAEDEGLRHRLGQAGRQFVTARFSEKRVNGLYLDEYWSLVRTFAEPGAINDTVGKT
jgi:glycosyltransferase involved in cell wall biosynthesis